MNSELRHRTGRIDGMRLLAGVGGAVLLWIAAFAIAVPGVAAQGRAPNTNDSTTDATTAQTAQIDAASSTLSTNQTITPFAVTQSTQGVADASSTLPPFTGIVAGSVVLLGTVGAAGATRSRSTVAQSSGAAALGGTQSISYPTQATPTPRPFPSTIPYTKPAEPTLPPGVGVGQTVNEQTTAVSYSFSSEGRLAGFSFNAGVPAFTSETYDQGLVYSPASVGIAQVQGRLGPQELHVNATGNATLFPITTTPTGQTNVSGDVNLSANITPESTLQLDRDVQLKIQGPTVGITETAPPQLTNYAGATLTVGQDPEKNPDAGPQGYLRVNVAPVTQTNPTGNAATSTDVRVEIGISDRF